MFCLNPFKARTRRDAIIDVPCGQCLHCRLQRRREWSLRLLFENMYHEESAFITLTYAEDPITLVPSDLQKFWKRYRSTGARVRYYAVGEYGEQLNRPHYHAIVFGDCPSREFLEARWPLGRVDTRVVTQERIAYCAGYVEKKLYGELARQEYEANGLLPPFSCMSSGIGKRYFEENWREIIDRGYIVFRGKPVGIPRYYFKVLESMLSELEYGAIRARLKLDSENRALEKESKLLGERFMNAPDEHYFTQWEIAKQMNRHLKAKGKINSLRKRK